jgi:hypothetical protein
MGADGGRSPRSSIYMGEKYQKIKSDASCPTQKRVKLSGIVYLHDISQSAPSIFLSVSFHTHNLFHLPDFILWLQG